MVVVVGGTVVVVVVVGGAVVPPAGRTSIAARFHRSVVGAVSFTITAVPAAGACAVWYCVQ